MSAAVGRSVIVKRDGTTIAGARTKTITVGDEAIDVTTDDDSGVRTLLEAGAQKQVDMAIDGLHKASNDDLIKALVNSTSLIVSFEVTLASGAKISGDARLNNYEIGAEYQDAVSFSAELHSSGTITWTDAP